MQFAPTLLHFAVFCVQNKNDLDKNVRECCFALKPNLEGGMRQSLFKTKHSIKGEALRIIHTKLFKEIMHRINEMILQNDLLNRKRYKFY